MKTALITGGNSGIGYATAALFKQQGYDVTITGRDAGRVDQAATQIGVSGIVADMAKLEDIQRIAQYFSNRPLDVLVNNAAVAKFMPISEHSPEDFQLFFDTNIRGPLALIQALLPSLQQASGSIVNVSSAVTRNGLPNASLYAATKGAMDSFTLSLARELAPQGIRINTVLPGAIDTPILAKLGVPPEAIAAIRAQQESMIPLGRYGQPEEVAQVILAQAQASYVTGAIWTVDGGVDAC